jgi:hypothetical protein
LPPRGVEEQEHVEQLGVLRIEERGGRRVLDVRPADVFAKRVEHHRQSLAIVGVTFGDEHDSDGARTALWRSAASTAALTGRLLRRGLIGAQPRYGSAERYDDQDSHQRCPHGFSSHRQN